MSYISSVAKGSAILGMGFISYKLTTEACRTKSFVGKIGFGFAGAAVGLATFGLIYTAAAQTQTEVCSKLWRDAAAVAGRLKGYQRGGDNFFRRTPEKVSTLYSFLKEHLQKYEELNCTQILGQAPWKTLDDFYNDL